MPMDCHRWGEAFHPGPSGEVPNIVQFGFSNPAGLRNKEEISVGLGPGVWSFYENSLVPGHTAKLCLHNAPVGSC